MPKIDVYDLNSIKQLIEKFWKDKLPLSILLLGDNWHLKDRANLQRFNSGFTFSKELFPNPNDLVEYVHQNGIKLGLSLDPSEGIHPHEPLFDDVAKAMGFSDKQIIPFNVFDKDMLNAYFELLIKPLYGYGVDFFWINYRNLKDKLSNDVLNYYHFNYYRNVGDTRPLILSRVSSS